MQNRYTDGSYLAENPTWHAEDAAWKLAHILRALTRAQVKSFSTVLDGGCGSGDILKRWARQAPKIQFTGWDISPQAHALAQKNAPENVRFVCADEPPAGPFDLALAIDVIEHVEQPGAWLKKLAARAPLVVLHVPLDLSVRSFLFPSLLARERKAVGHIHFFTARLLKKFLKQNHCQILSACYTNKYVERPPQLTSLKSRIGMIIRQAAHAVSCALAAFFIGGYSLMLVVQTNCDTNREAV